MTEQIVEEQHYESEGVLPSEVTISLVMGEISNALSKNAFSSQARFQLTKSKGTVKVVIHEHPPVPDDTAIEDTDGFWEDIK